MTDIIERLTDRELQTLRNMGNDCERAADEIEALRAWRDTVDDMLTTLHTVASDDPRESINRLINWHVAVALDPAVSSDAAALVAAERERTRPLIELCRAALAEELSAWDIDPPLHHVKTAHDACCEWLSAHSNAIRQAPAGEKP